MVIQRWQSVFLLLASIMMGVSCFTPFASLTIADGDVQALYPSVNTAYLVLNALIAVMLFVSIFLFKNTKRQKTVAMASVLMMLASAATAGILVYSTLENAVIDWTGGALLLGCALVMTLAAYRRVCADEKLLKSYDRIR